MTMPDDSTAALLGQILAKQGELLTQMAVMGKTLEAIPDHENRLRDLERWRYALPTSVLLGLASAATTIGYWVAHAHK
jgi:hypothetical protein